MRGTVGAARGLKKVVADSGGVEPTAARSGAGGPRRGDLRRKVSFHPRIAALCGHGQSDRWHHLLSKAPLWAVALQQFLQAPLASGSADQSAALASGANALVAGDGRLPPGADEPRRRPKKCSPQTTRAAQGIVSMVAMRTLVNKGQTQTKIFVVDDRNPRGVLATLNLSFQPPR
jgi:hypothetical protein